MTAPSIPKAGSGRSALDVARDAAYEGGRLAMERFRRPHDVTVKGRGNLVTQTDLDVERLLHETLRRAFPDHAVLSEETASETGTVGWVWVVDPVDGTRNFVSGIPYFCVNLALCRDGEPLVAVTHDPARDETFWAERGGGAWLNDKPVRASSASRLREAVLAVDLGYDEARGRTLLRLAYEALPEVQAVRVSGSASLGLAYAAAGRFDVFVHRFLYPWDIAAGILLVQEAGGTITDDTGGSVSLRSQSAIAGGAKLHADLLRWQQERGLTFDALDS